MKKANLIAKILTKEVMNENYRGTKRIIKHKKIEKTRVK
jgi:hypothetical protein